jgi:hypothetical protein
MKTIITALAFATLVATSALAQSSYSYPSYDCGPSQYDSSGAPVAQDCGR